MGEDSRNEMGMVQQANNLLFGFVKLLPALVAGHFSGGCTKSRRLLKASHHWYYYYYHVIRNVQCVLLHVYSSPSQKQPLMTPCYSFHTHLCSPVERSDLLLMITMNEVDNVRRVMEPRSVGASQLPHYCFHLNDQIRD